MTPKPHGQESTRASQLLFRDVDGDGRTDVLALHGTVMNVSRAGGSPWQDINNTSFALGVDVIR